MSTPIFEDTWRALHPPTARHRLDRNAPPLPRRAGLHRHALDASTEEFPVTAPEENPPADTAGEEDHSDPWALAGDDVAGPQPGEVPDGVA